MTLSCYLFVIAFCRGDGDVGKQEGHSYKKAEMIPLFFLTWKKTYRHKVFLKEEQFLPSNRWDSDSDTRLMSDRQPGAGRTEILGPTWQRGLALMNGNLLLRTKWGKHKPLIDSSFSTHRSSVSRCPDLTAPCLGPQGLTLPLHLPPSPQNLPPSWTFSPKSSWIWPIFSTGLQPQGMKGTFWPPPAPRPPPTTWEVLPKPAVPWEDSWRLSLWPETTRADPRPTVRIYFGHSSWLLMWRLDPWGCPGSGEWHIPVVLPSALAWKFSGASQAVPLQQGSWNFLENLKKAKGHNRFHEVFPGNMKIGQ